MEKVDGGANLAESRDLSAFVSAIFQVMWPSHFDPITNFYSGINVYSPISQLEYYVWGNSRRKLTLMKSVLLDFAGPENGEKFSMASHGYAEVFLFLFSECEKHGFIFARSCPIGSLIHCQNVHNRQYFFRSIPVQRHRDLVDGNLIC